LVFSFEYLCQKDMVSPKPTDSANESLLSLLQQDDIAAFERLYDLLAKRVFHFVYNKVRRKDTSEEILQEIFVALWNNRKTLQISTTIEAYLFGAAKNKIMTYIRSEQVRRRYAAEFTRFAQKHYDNSVQEQLDVDDLQVIVQTKIAELPDKCQTAFRMSRMEHTPIAQIALKMNISTRTVENYITQALRHLRTHVEIQ
jgi:RNA polymerase sigma-70 factor (family 1)